jgi:hypothetical protein
VALSACSPLAKNTAPAKASDQATITLDTVEIFAHQRCAKSDFAVVAGQQYRLTIIAKSSIQDNDIAVSRPPVSSSKRCQDHSYSKKDTAVLIDERGFCNESLSSSAVMSHFKQSKKHEWFELVIATDNCDKNSMVGISTMKQLSQTPVMYQFTAIKTGKLSGFVNDAGWFYGNNKGYYLLSLEAVKP